jgi:hypothetical protein
VPKKRVGKRAKSIEAGGRPKKESGKMSIPGVPMRGPAFEMSVPVQPLQGLLMQRPPKWKAPTAKTGQLQLRLPIQAVPVNRSEVGAPNPFAPPAPLPAWIITVGNLKFIPAVFPPIRNSHAYFSGQVDQRLGICPVLSAYAVARCFRAGGLF